MYAKPRFESWAQAWGSSTLNAATARGVALLRRGGVMAVGGPYYHDRTDTSRMPGTRISSRWDPGNTLRIYRHDVDAGVAVPWHCRRRARRTSSTETGQHLGVLDVLVEEERHELREDKNRGSPRCRATRGRWQYSRGVGLEHG